MNRLNSNVPEGKIDSLWEDHKFNMKLVNPANRRKFNVIVVGTGLAGASAAATLSEQGYNVKAFTFHDTPRRAHSIAAQGGINAAKNYQNDGDSVYRLFYDTVKGGDFRSREANVYRLSQVSANIIDQCVAQGVPFARDYGGLLTNRSFGGAQVSRTFYARGQTGQQLLLGAYQAMMKQVHAKNIELFTRHEMLDLVVKDGQARGIISRDLVTGEVKKHMAHAVLLCTGGYGNVYYLSTNAMNSNVTAAWRCHRKGADFANPCFTQIHPTCIPQSGEGQSKLTLMSESLRNDGRVWVPKQKGEKRHPRDIPESDRDYYLERIYPSFGNLVPRDVASRQAKYRVDEGRGVGATGVAVYLDFKDAIIRAGKSKSQEGDSQEEILKLGKEVISEKYGNLFQMYKQITGENPYEEPMRIYPAVHYTMGGLWVDYHLQSTVKGLFVLGEANFSDHGSNRLGASALMQGLADGYFVIPYTLGNYLGSEKFESISEDDKCFDEAKKAVSSKVEKLLNVKGKTSVDDFHKRLGKIMWEYVGMSRSTEGLTKAIKMIQELRAEFWKDVKIPGSKEDFNQELEKAGRVADFLEMGELMARDALNREESCGGHFREEHQTAEGEAVRHDEDFGYVAAWEWQGEDQAQKLNKESLKFENVKLATRSYK